jgi:predicted SAM-dependent methyltransferase
MEIKDSSFYSIKETSKIVNVSSRTLQRIAKKKQNRIIDGRYLFTGFQIKELLALATQQTTTSRQTTEINDNVATLKAELKSIILKYEEFKKDNGKQLDLQVQSLEREIEKLKEENKNLKLELTNDLPHKEKLKKAIQLITLEAMEQGIQHKVFTDEEYQDLIGTISEVDFQKEQVEYLRSRVEKQDTILEKLVQQVSERNFIEAKSKGYDKK